MNGGTSIGAGSDGCVFDGTFAPDGTFTVDDNLVTKVYPPKYNKVAQNEWKSMELVKNAIGEERVILAKGPPQPIASIPAEAWGSTGTSLHACGVLKKASDAGEAGILGLVLPRINGDLNDAKGTIVDSDEFNFLNEVLLKLGQANIVHMDIAARNIFYTLEDDEDDDEPQLYVGDFGSAFNFMAEDFDESIKRYVDRYKIRGNFLKCTRMDGIHPLTLLFIIYYDALLSGEETYSKLLKEVNDQKYKSMSDSIATRTWMCRTVRAVLDDPFFADCLNDEERYLREEMLASYNSLVDSISGDIQTIIYTHQKKMGTYAEAIKRKDAMKDYIQKRLRWSDRSVLDCLRMSYESKSEFNKQVIEDFIDQWFPDITKAYGGKRKKRGGSTCQTRRSEEKPTTKWNVATDEELLEEDPRIEEEIPLQLNPEDVPEASIPLLPYAGTSTGGKKHRKTLRKRQKRVKMSRRK